MTDTEHFRLLSMLHKLEDTKDDTGVLTFAQAPWLTNLPPKISVSGFLDIEEFALVLDEVEYQCLFDIRNA
jgi:hypothetical protein